MAMKTTPPKTGGSSEGIASPLRAEAERLIAGERFKDAVKQAKLCYKEQATPHTHRLLERAYFLRARQLLQQGMRSSAVEVVQHLLDFGVTGADSPEELVWLLVGLGFDKAAMSIQDRLGVPELKEQVSQAVADQLVIHPERAGPAPPELARDAGLVRKALEALQSGDEAGALGMLRELPRSSPLSEWKFFLRGLAAFERGDDLESQANWDHLQSGRACSAIAERLRRMGADSAGPSGPGLEAAEKRAFGEPILERLRRLAALVASHEWDQVLPLIGSMRQSLHRVEPRLAERLTNVLIGSVVKAVQDMDWHDAHSLIARFCRAAQPLEIDPRWNRLWALIWDGPHADPTGAIHYWTDYIDDLGTVRSLGTDEIKLARALVWNHIAELHRQEVDNLADEDGPPPFLGPRRGRGGKSRRDTKRLATARKSVVAAIEKSLKLAPEHLPTYRLLVDVHADWGDDNALEAAAQRLLAKFPEDLEVLQRLAGHHFERKDPRAALPYILSARRLKPLDDSLRSVERTIHVAMARQYALERKWDEGRAEFAAAEALKPPDGRDFAYLARRAMLEYKAGQTEAGDGYVQQAQGALVEPAPLWLAVLIESIRFKMPKQAVDRYAKLWDAELKKKRHSETAGEMAGVMLAFLASDTEYTGRATHIKKIVEYLRKTTTLKYRREDIERVAEFLGRTDPRDRKLYQTLVKAGLKQYPDSAPLHLDAAEVEMMGAGLGAMFGAIPPGVRQHTETALKLAEASNDPKVTALLPMIRQRLGSLDEVSEAMGRFGFGGGPFGPGPGGGPPGLDFLEMLGAIDEWDDDDLDEDEFDDDEPFTLDGGPAPRRAPSRGQSRSRSTKRTRRKK
jgi:tetratricopeptide (TPR) repeat protein